MMNQIQDVWRVEQEILDVIHCICIENKLKYSLAYGTLLGAVRHGGFIPWDDDIDLMMPREDYEKLLELWDSVAPTGFILQNGRRESDFTQSFSKIRKDHTVFLQNENERKKKYHKGIFVDIFPGDRVPNGRLRRKLQYIACAISLLYTRGHTSGTRGVIGWVERVLLCVPKQFYPKFREYSNSFIQQWNRLDDCQYVFSSTIQASKKYYPSDLFNDMGEIEFNGKRYSCVRKLDEVLQCEYGDYMRYPPVEERIWKHHPIMLSFDHNYEELNQNV